MINSSTKFHGSETQSCRQLNKTFEIAVSGEVDDWRCTVSSAIQYQCKYLHTETKILAMNYRQPRLLSVLKHNTDLNGATGHITVLIISMSCNQKWQSRIGEEGGRHVHTLEGCWSPPGLRLAVLSCSLSYSHFRPSSTFVLPE
jgi:hypothetical protein